MIINPNLIAIIASSWLLSSIKMLNDGHFTLAGCCFCAVAEEDGVRDDIDCLVDNEEMRRAIRLSRSLDARGRVQGNCYVAATCLWVATDGNISVSHIQWSYVHDCIILLTGSSLLLLLALCCPSLSLFHPAFHLPPPIWIELIESGTFGINSIIVRHCIALN